MKTHNIKNFRELFENFENKKLNEDEKDSENIEYEYYDSKGKITESISQCDKAIAVMKSGQSAKFTKLVNDLEESKADMARLKKEIESQEIALREEIANHFDESFDGVATMVIKTCKNIITLARGGKSSTTKYAQVLKEFEKELTPELRKVLDDTVEKYTTVSNKKQALTIKGTSQAGRKSVNENFVGKIIDGVKKFASVINRWTKSYSNKMDKIMKKADVVEETENKMNLNSKLVDAAKTGNDRVIEILLNKGAEITPAVLTASAINGHLETIKFLQKKGAKIDKIGQEALKAAEKNNHRDVVKFLRSVMS